MYYSYIEIEYAATSFSPARMGLALNLLTAVQSVPAGTKNYRSEGFWLAKHKQTNIPTMMEPFAPPGAWFC
jgi:hypothetical protein